MALFRVKRDCPAWLVVCLARGDVGKTSKLDGTLVMEVDVGKDKYLNREASKRMLLKGVRRFYVKMWPGAMGKKSTVKR